MLGISLFGGLFAWLLIFITHYRFRRHWDTRTDRTLPVRVKYFPLTTILGGTAVLAVLISTWWVDGMRVTLQAGVPWLVLLTIAYYARRTSTRDGCASGARRPGSRSLLRRRVNSCSTSTSA